MLGSSVCNRDVFCFVLFFSLLIFLAQTHETKEEKELGYKLKESDDNNENCHTRSFSL